jgi:hypothetical protein
MQRPVVARVCGCRACDDATFAQPFTQYQHKNGISRLVGAENTEAFSGQNPLVSFDFSWLGGQRFGTIRAEWNEARCVLRDVPILTALDTGMRQCEMLALRFGDINQTTGVITLRGETTKNGISRRIPISTARLRAVLEWLRLDGAGEKKADGVLVFSDETGEPIGRFRTAWVTTVLKAHGIKPLWKAHGWP